MASREKRMHACLYSNDGRVEMCEQMLALEDEIAELRDLCGKAYAMCNYLLAREPLLVADTAKLFVEIDALMAKFDISRDDGA